MKTFNNVDTLKYNETTKTIAYLRVFNSQFINGGKTKKKHIRLKNYLYLKYRLNIIIKVILYKDCRDWFIKRKKLN